MITINIDKAKTVAHGLRRSARAAEFEPLDAVVAKQIPGTDFVAIEAARKAVRQKFSAMQAAIDAAESVEALKAAL